MCEFKCKKTGLTCCFECDKVGYCEERCEDALCDNFDLYMISMLRSASYRKAQEQGVD